MTKVINIKKNKQTAWKIEGEDFKYLHRMRTAHLKEKDRLETAAQELQSKADAMADEWWDAIKKIIDAKSISLSFDESFEEAGFYIVKKLDLKKHSLHALIDKFSLGE